jgi:ribosomal protein S18 acetylase RimI-like enzyme
MTEEDVPALVRLHSEVFEGYNSTVMGNGYLKSLYRTLACDIACISIVALEGGELVGWIGGVRDWLSFEKALTRQSILRAPTILVSILKNRPKLLARTFSVGWRVFSGFTRVRERRSTPRHRVTSSMAAALLVIGVAPTCQNQGLGQFMMQDFHSRLLSEGFATCTLHALSENEAGNKAFRKVGYRLLGRDQGVNHYIKYLTDQVVE